MIETIHRTRKIEDPFARVPHDVLNDKRLSWKAKGLFAYLIGKPTHWKISVADMIARSTDGEDSVRSALDELRKAGYARLESWREPHGAIKSWHWHIYDSPDPENPDLEKPDVANPDLENPPPSKKDRSKKNRNKKEGTPHNPPGGGKRASKICLPDLPEPLQHGRIPEAWEQFLDHRREMKKPVTKTSAYRIFADLYEWQQTYGTDFAARSLENSVRNGWQGVFMPDFSKHQKPNGSPNIHPMNRLKIIKEQIEAHPANITSIKHDENCGEEKKQELRNLRAKRDQLEAEIANG